VCIVTNQNLTIFVISRSSYTCDLDCNVVYIQSVDADRNGKIAPDELQKALLNGNWSPFNQETCRLMIGMFDTDK